MRRHPQLVPLFVAVVTIIWTVWLLSCSGDKSSEPVKLIYRVQDANLKAGYYCFCWNQLNQQGQHVDPGVFRAHMTAGDFDTTINFTIAAGSSPISAPLCCDTMTVGTLKPSGGVPDKFGLALNAASYSTSDSIAVDFALPVSCKCVIDMEQR
jgi:hypothetical protein